MAKENELLIIPLTVGPNETNCYLVSQSHGRDCLVIDPGAEADKIIKAAADEQLRIKTIVLTHAHYDHIGAVSKLQEATHATLCLHKDEAAVLEDPIKNLSTYIGTEAISLKTSCLLEDGELLEVGGVNFKIIHTPGHTPGSISILAGLALFCGDLIFQGSVGRTDLPGGDSDLLHRSVHEKIMTLNDEITIYPGHGPATTLGWERWHNPFLVAGW